MVSRHLFHSSLHSSSCEELKALFSRFHHKLSQVTAIALITASASPYMTACDNWNI